MNEFKAGDKVICPEAHHEWGDWSSDMDKYVGKEGVFICVDSDGDAYVKHPDGECWYYKPEFLIHAQQIKITKNKTKPKKVVRAYGQEWHVPNWAKFMAIDGDSGSVIAYKEKPVCSDTCWHLYGCKQKLIGKADLNGVDWKTTLTEI